MRFFYRGTRLAQEIKLTLKLPVIISHFSGIRILLTPRVGRDLNPCFKKLAYLSLFLFANLFFIFNHTSR